MDPIKDGDRFFIVPKCCADATPKLAVGMQATESSPGIYNVGQAQLMVPDPKDNRLRWRTMTKDGGVILLNDADVGFGCAVLTAPYANSPTVMMSEQQIWGGENPQRHWEVIPQPNSDWFALQLHENHHQNLNVGGDGPYVAGNVIYAYKWSDGRPNELWQFQKIPD